LHTIAVVLAVTLYAPATAAARLDSGIRGYVTYGPTCPVERPGERCERPYDATLRIRVRTTHRLVVTVRSGGDGRFRVRLQPGRYVIDPVAGHPFPRASPVFVTVRAHRFATATIAFDSGIR
jgi:hypothetical protein